MADSSQSRTGQENEYPEPGPVTLRAMFVDMLRVNWSYGIRGKLLVVGFFVMLAYLVVTIASRVVA